MKILIGCEFSQVVTKAFRDQGHKAYSCDFEPPEINPEWHLYGDVRDYLNNDWDLGIFHPPCTYLCNSGVRWLHTQPGRWQKMIDACDFFKELLNASIKRIAIENPIPHKYAVEQIGRKYNFAIQPYEFGHGEQKKTCFWTKNLPPLQPTNIVDGREQRIWKLPPGENRWKERSRTFSGIAEAIAKQWGEK